MTLDSSFRPDPPDISHIVTEDDEPMESWYHAKVARLLTSSLRASWEGPGPGRTFIVEGNVGIFYGLHTPPVVPDVFVSCDVTLPEDWWAKRHRCYFVWEFGKHPEVAVEIVSNRRGGEDDRKREIYAEIGVPWYVIYDPNAALKKGALRVLELRAGRYVARRDNRIPKLGLGVTLWEGQFEESTTTWLRWTDAEGNLLATPTEVAEAARDAADAARGETEAALERAAALEAKLRALGVDPDDIG